jgi:hypothetical protein
MMATALQLERDDGFSAAATRRRRAAVGWTVAALLALSATAAAAQPLLEVHEKLDFDHPEAWAMKYFSAVSLLSGMGVPKRLAPGAVEVAFEGGWVPSLSAEERTVGFYGTKEEDLNKTPVFGRGRVTVGLPAAFSFTLAWVPPLEVGGVKPNLLAAAVGRPLFTGERLRLGLRLFAQRGTIEGDITCSREDAAAGEDPVGNPFGCEAPSKDELHADYTGLELGAAFRAGRSGNLEPYAAVAASFLDPRFQVDALYSGFHDRTLQTTRGTVHSLAAGLVWAASAKTRVTAEAFYCPLDLVRRPGGPKESQDLLNLRLMIAYRVR